MWLLEFWSVIKLLLSDKVMFDEITNLVEDNTVVDNGGKSWDNIE